MSLSQPNPDALAERLQADPLDEAAHGLVRQLFPPATHSRSLIDFYRKLQRANPHDWRHQFNLAKAYSAVGKDSMAVVQHQKLLRSDPTKAEVWLELADCYLRLKKQELALRSLNSLLDSDPLCLPAHHKRLRILIGSEEPDEAAAAVILALETNRLPEKAQAQLEELDTMLEQGLSPDLELLEECFDHSS